MEQILEPDGEQKFAVLSRTWQGACGATRPPLLIRQGYIASPVNMAAALVTAHTESGPVADTQRQSLLDLAETYDLASGDSLTCRIRTVTPHKKAGMRPYGEMTVKLYDADQYKRQRFKCLIDFEAARNCVRESINRTSFRRYSLLHGAQHDGTAIEWKVDQYSGNLRHLVIAKAERMGGRLSAIQAPASVRDITHDRDFTGFCLGQVTSLRDFLAEKGLHLPKPPKPLAA